MIVRLLVVLVALLAVGAGLFLAQHGDPTADSQPADVNRPGPGYSARDATLIETGEDGLPLYNLHAATIEQTPQSDMVHLTDITMDFRDSAGGVWNLRANRSDVRQSSQSLNLYGDVRITGTPSGSKSPARINTEMLSFDSRSEIATTHAPVVLDWSGQKINAVGLFANLKDRRVRLESEVHGIFSR